jgi:hypothetical protein
MLGTTFRGNMKVGCANATCNKRRYPASELLFVCSGKDQCEALRSPEYREYFDGQKTRFADQFLFRPRRFAYSVKCPVSGHNSFIKVCPNCGTQQPVSTGDTSTIAVIGPRSSGKTCFITSLIHQIDNQLARQSMYRMSLEWRDDEGRKYFRDQRDTLFKKLQLPINTQKHLPLRSLDITIRFPLRGWTRWLRHGSQATIPLVFPDPSGELFVTLNDAYSLSFLHQSPQVLLMLDPLSSPKMQESRKQSGIGALDGSFDDPEDALNSLVIAVRAEMGLSRGKIPKDLAVVLTKCDEPNVFDPDNDAYAFHQQGGRYDPRLANNISQYVERHLEEDLGIPKVVALAKENFRSVCFFAASALGTPPQKRKDEDGDVRAWLSQAPKPRRVEEPFLWLLHRRGLV